MEFCSKYGYDYGFEGSDSEDISDEDVETKQTVKKKVRKTDSNIIAVKFDELVVANETFAGEPKRCTNCQAIVSSFSRENIKTENNKLIWTCEFCETVNDLGKLMMQSLDEVPNKEDVTYLIEPAPQSIEIETDSNEEVNNKIISKDDNYLTYCIDISGSMDTKIPSNNMNNNENNHYISRLKGVKIACLENLSNLQETEPNKKVSLVTFSDGIKFFGDGTKASIHNPLIDTSKRSYNYQPQIQLHYIPSPRPNSFLKNIGRIFNRNKNTSSDNNNYQNNVNNNDTIEIANDILFNKEKMLALAQNQNEDLNGVSKSYPNLKNIIENLKTEGSTALGPALAFSIGYSSRREGSQIILCTDGAANIGMGSVDYCYLNESEKFYDDLADYAKSKGITVNIVSMEGTDCKLALLGRVADKTNGTMNIVNPNNLSEKFKSILENRIVATSVKATLIVNYNYLYIRDKELEAEEGKAIDFGNKKSALDKLDQLKKSKIAKDIGNANIDTEITFEYGIRRQKGEKKTQNLNELPFQLQIEYTQNGAKFIRVYTKKQIFTKSRDKALDNLLSKEMIWSNGMQKMSEQAICSNVGFSNYRSHALTKFSNSRNFIKPKMLIQQQQMMKRVAQNSNKGIMAYNDDDACLTYATKNANRKYF